MPLSAIILILRGNYNDPPTQWVLRNVPIRLIDPVPNKSGFTGDRGREGWVAEAENSNLQTLNWYWRQREWKKVK